MPRNASMTPRRSRARTMVLLGLVLLTLLDNVGGIPYKRSLLRLCSKSLSDALYLACKGRGYNEPFSYSGEDDPQDSVGPGLAEECCYHQCSYSQLEQYCKPDKTNPADVEKNSIWIENFPYPSTRPEMSSSEERSRSEIEYVAGSIKCRIHGSKGTRKKGSNMDRDDDAAICCDMKSRQRRNRGGHFGCRHRRLRRRRLGKPLERMLTSIVPKSSGKSSPLP